MRTWTLHVWGVSGLFVVIVAGACDSIPGVEPPDEVETTPRSHPSRIREASEESQASSSNVPDPDTSSPPELSTDPIILVPEGAPPDDGWPTVVLLHGYRAGPSDLVPIAEIARDVGFVAISLPAPLERGEGHYHWKLGEPVHTHRYVQHHLEAIDRRVRTEFRRSAVGLIGFSQGALHSLHLIAEHPGRYRGWIGISPAGWTEVPERLAPHDDRGHFVITGGRREPQTYRQTFVAARTLLQQSKVSLHVVEHDGGHEFPPDWRGWTRSTLEQWREKRAE